jgi:hypothetical protein
MFIYQANQREDKFQKLAATFGSCSFVSACTPSVTNKSVWESWSYKDFKNASAFIKIIMEWKYEEKKEIDYIWVEPKTKDPAADYKEGKFPKIDEAIRNAKKGKR